MRSLKNARRAAVFGVVALTVMGVGLSPASAKPQPRVEADSAINEAGEISSPDFTEKMPGFSGSVGSAPLGDSTESIIGADQRTQVTNTTAYPARAVGLITLNGNHHCTGWLISKDTVLTAGHCVNTGGNGSTNGTWYSGLRFFPGRSGNSWPYGSCVPRSGGLTSFVGWVRDGDEQHDAGIIKLNCSIGNTTGWFGLWWQSASLDGNFTRINGYPGDKPRTQWMSTDSVRATTTYQVFYQNDTLGGMSGSPVWRYRGTSEPYCTGACGMAIHAYGLHGSPPHSTNNHGTRNTQAKYNVYHNIAVAP
jgi:glutamyl endopeptidase